MKIEEFKDPYLGKTWADLGARILSSGKHVSVTLGYPALGYKAELTELLSAHLGGAEIELDVQFSPPRARGFDHVKHVIAVASGKGGVGKSTITANFQGSQPELLYVFENKNQAVFNVAKGVPAPNSSKISKDKKSQE